MAKFLDSMGTLDRVPKENFAANMDEAKQIIRPLLHPQSSDESPWSNRTFLNDCLQGPEGRIATNRG